MFGHKPRKVDAEEHINYGGKTVINPIKRCCHCGSYWKIQPGSGKPHVHCSYCADDTCSNPQCMTKCTPLEKRIEEESKALQFWYDVANGKTDGGGHVKLELPPGYRRNP